MENNLPAGTVTFLFTDIEGSTQLWERHPQAMPAALAGHDALLAQAITAHGGALVKRTGDGCLAAFPTVLAGVRAAMAAQRALAAEPWTALAPDTLRVRMALHTGEAEAREGDYFGPALNRAARLMATGHGGQVLLSQVAADLAREQLPEAASLRDLGQHRLKDLTRPEHIFQLNAPDLPSDFPALRSLDATPHNLPVQLTHFVGREQQIAEVRRLLSETALLTLTGSGGTGKTRLSLQVAAESLPKFPDGAWLVELAPVTDPVLVVQAICTALGVRQQPQRSLLDSLLDFLRGKHLLLILDNCEHLISACAEVADQLLRQCARLKIIASSREALGIAGETTYPVPSLSLPAAAGALDLAEIARSEAVRLFVERAQAALPSFTLTAENAAAVAIICRRLDGIPLAIVLAAARVKLLTVAQIAARLDDRFRLLTGGSRTALPRQQTLRALIDWSYALLSDPERQFLQVLSVFAGGWTLEAAEAVVQEDEGRRTALRDEASPDSSFVVRLSSIEPSPAPLDALDLLSQLANKSLVVVDQDTGAEPRYRLLETIRQYARDKLFDAGDPVLWRTRHLQHFRRYAVEAQPALYSRQMALWLNRFQAEHDNFRAAMEWALQTDALAAMQLAEALGFYLARRGFRGEALEWFSQAAAHGRAASQGAAAGALAEYPPALARVLTARAIFDFGLTSSRTEAREAAEEAVRLARELGDRLTLARALGALGMIAAFWGDPAAAYAAGAEALALGRELRDNQATILGQGALGIADQRARDDPSSQRPRLEEALHLARAAGNPFGTAMATLNLARLDGASGDAAATRARYAEAIRLFTEIGDTTNINGVRSDLAHALRRLGLLDEAMDLYQQTLRGWQHMGARGAVAHQLESFAQIVLARRQPERAARLLGAAEALRESSGAVRMALERVEYASLLDELRALLPAPELEAAWAAGRALNIDEAVAYALGPTDAKA